jgi:FkbM family methyltransferase
MTIPETREFVSWIEANSNREKILFGAGQWGNWIRETFNNVKWDYFADNNVTSEEINGLRVLDVKELADKHKGACIVITSKYHWKDILDQLIVLGFNENQIYLFGREIAKVESRIYFDLTALPKLDYEVFVDGGGYDGNSSLDFIRWANGDYNIKIFEPDTDSKAKCERAFLENNRVNIIPKGLWSEPTYLNFEINGTESKIVQNSDIGGVIRVPVTTIDEVCKGELVTFIKMDIEGSEYNALIGASDTIKKYKPKLAISIYHKPEDIIEIPKLLLNMNPDYKFWIRHYSMTWFDTVLYAV